MAVYDRGYRGYRGKALTPYWSRSLVLSRYALRDVFASRFFLVFFCACFIWPLMCTFYIYLQYNLKALDVVPFLREIIQSLKIDTFFFRFAFLQSQSMLAFLVAMVVGPALLSADMRNNAMPLYLSRPLNRFDYAFGKWLVLALLLSAITWVPGLALFFLQAYFAGSAWFFEHLQIALGLFLGSWVWIFLLSLFALALSAWVKWKLWARAFYLGAFVLVLIIAEIFKAWYGTWYGGLMSPFDVVNSVWSQLFAMEAEGGVPAAAAWLALFAFWGLCLGLLFRRIRAYEVTA